MKVQVCIGKACASRYSEYILKRLNADKEFYNLKDDKVEITECPCTGNCKVGPSVIFNEEIEVHMDPAKASKIMMDTINGVKKKFKKKKYKKKDTEKSQKKDKKTKK